MNYYAILTTSGIKDTAQLPASLDPFHEDKRDCVFDL